MKWYQWLVIGLTSGLQWGCQQANEQYTSAPLAKENMLMEAPPPPPPSAPAEAIAQNTPLLPRGESATAPAARLLVYHADVRLKTAKMPHAMSRLDSLVRRSGGYLSAATETHADGEWRQETTIRVPPTRFQSLLNGLAGLGTIEEKKLSTDDITAEHADVTARLQTKRAVERQYTTLLIKAQKIKDILDIEEKLGEVREEIEATEKRGCLLYHHAHDLPAPAPSRARRARGVAGQPHGSSVLWWLGVADYLVYWGYQPLAGAAAECGRLLALAAAAVPPQRAAA